MRRIFEANPGKLFPPVFVGDDLIEHPIGVRNARKGDGYGAEGNLLRNSLEVALNPRQKPPMDELHCICARPFGRGAGSLIEALARTLHHIACMSTIPPTTAPAKARKVRSEPMMAAPMPMRSRPMAMMSRRKNIQTPATHGPMASQGFVPPGMRARRLGLIR